MTFTEEELKQALENILEALGTDEVEKHDWYASLFPEGMGGIAEELDDYQDSTYATVYGEDEEEERYSFEHVLAIEAIKYPELHELMRKIVLKITEHGEQGNFEQLWENEEVQAGGAFARELAMYDKADIPLYYRYIQTNDLDHEVYQLDDMLAILAKWEYAPETMPILFYRQDNGQNAGVYGDNICKDPNTASQYLDYLVAYFKEEWSFDENDEDDIEETKKWLASLFANVFSLDEEQMHKFTVEFVRQMANEQAPTMEALLNAAKG